MTVRNQVQLITYPDSLGENLLELHWVLKKYLKDAIGGVHLLPFYPSSADRGFAPLTYKEVDPAFGAWEDVRAIARDYDLMVDFMVNHISRSSEYFQDYLEKGQDSPYADMFLGFHKLSPDGEIPDEVLDLVYKRKPRPPYAEIVRADGSREKVWCTFDDEQIDLDWQSRKTREVMRQQVIRLARAGSRIIRMDAFAYTTLKLGTNCFFIEPEVWEILSWLREFTDPFETEILPEVHEHHGYQLKLAEKGYWAYDFALPMLMIHTLYHRNNKRLLEWLRICPRRQFTTLDTHDGIGAVDVSKLMTVKEVERTIDELYEKGSNIKQVYSGPDYHNLDIYQVNCTYFSALESNEDMYIAARAIQFFTPGIPQVYYVGLLAGENDIELVEYTRNGRDINRHNYTIDEIRLEFERPVVQRLLELMRFRNRYEVFDGEFSIEQSPEEQVVLTWSAPPLRATLFVDLADYTTRIEWFDPESGRTKAYTP